MDEQIKAPTQAVEFGVRSQSYSAETPLPAPVLLERLEELLFAKVRPKRRRHHKFRVGNLPKQKIADPHFAAGADQQIRVGIMARVEVLGNCFLVDFRRFDFSAPDLAGDVADRLDKFILPPITKGQD